MIAEPFLDFSRREQLREWLTANHASAGHAWVACSRSKTPRPDAIPYVEIVEECLCFGWIDSTLKKMPDGRLAQRISPRRKGSHWTLRNRERCMELEQRGLMTDAGREAQKTHHDILIETCRLRFRPWADSDAEALFKYASDPDVGPRAGWPPHQSVAESLKVIRDIFSNGHTWALEFKATGEPIGCMGYYVCGESNIGIGEEDAELGYWIAKPYWNHGLCTEALRAMIDWCFNKKGFQTLWADFFVDNPASGRVMEKCGFRDTGEVNWLSQLYRGDERPVKVMRLDYAL